MALEKKAESKEFQAISHMADFWEYLNLLREINDDLEVNRVAEISSDIKRKLQLLFEESEGFGDLVGLSKIRQKKWVRVVGQDKNSMLKQYANYLSKINSREELESLYLKLAENLDEVSIYLNELLLKSPLIGTVAAHIDIKQPRLVWYRESLEKSALINGKIERFFSILQSKTRNSDLRIFLGDLKNNLQGVLIDCVNVANGFYIHISEEDCAVLMSHAEFNLEEEDFDLVKERLRELGKYPIYQNYWPQLGEYLEHLDKQKSGVIKIPCYISVLDIQMFLDFFDTYWTGILNGLEENKHRYYENDLDKSTHVFLKNAAMILCRPKPVPGKGQARVSLRANGSLAKFNVRVDQDKRGNLGLDIGGVSVMEALAYATEMGEASEKEDVVMKYSVLVNKDGKLFADRNKRKEYYPSIMRSQATDGEGNFLNHGSRAALFASVITKQCSHLDFRMGKTFSYHLSDPNLDRHRDKFEFIVRELVKTLIG